MADQAHGVVLVDVDVHDDGTDRFPEYDWNTAPKHALATRRQLRARGLRPGGHDPVALLRCKKCTGLTRDCTRRAWLYRIDLALPIRPMTLAKEIALDRAMEARQRCPLCRRRYFHCIPLKTLGSCLECADGTPAAPGTYTPPSTQDLAA
ncbi:RRQRL motif-containing zinc-binding protein [Streptomyces sp. NPDC004031]